MNLLNRMKGSLLLILLWNGKNCGWKEQKKAQEGIGKNTQSKSWKGRRGKNGVARFPKLGGRESVFDESTEITGHEPQLGGGLRVQSRPQRGWLEIRPKLTLCIEYRDGTILSFRIWSILGMDEVELRYLGEASAQYIRSAIHIIFEQENKRLLPNDWLHYLTQNDVEMIGACLLHRRRVIDIPLHYASDGPSCGFLIEDKEGQFHPLRPLNILDFRGTEEIRTSWKVRTPPDCDDCELDDCVECSSTPFLAGPIDNVEWGIANIVDDPPSPSRMDDDDN